MNPLARCIVIAALFWGGSLDIPVYGQDTDTPTVAVDLAGPAMKGRIPFRKPFLVDVPGVGGVDSAFVHVIRTNHRRTCGSAAGDDHLRSMRPWNAKTGDGTFRLQAPGLKPDRDYTFLVTVVRKKESTINWEQRQALALQELVDLMKRSQPTATWSPVDQVSSVSVPKQEVRFRTHFAPGIDTAEKRAYRDCIARVQKTVLSRDVSGRGAARCSDACPGDDVTGAPANARVQNDADPSTSIAVETYVVNARARATLASHFQTDIGISLPIGRAETMSLVTGARFYFVPQVTGGDLLDPSVPQGMWSQLARRASLFASISVFDLYSGSDASVKKLGPLGAPSVGVSLHGFLYWGNMNSSPFLQRFIQPLHLNAGVMFFQQEDANPIVDTERRKWDYFISISADVSFKQVLGPIGKLFGD